MLFPIRCYTCNSVIGRHETLYNIGIDSGKTPGEMFDKLKIKRICCKRMFLGHENTFERISRYTELPEDVFIYTNSF